jgi:hypothetical protein
MQGLWWALRIQQGTKQICTPPSWNSRERHRQELRKYSVTNNDGASEGHENRTMNIFALA